MRILRVPALANPPGPAWAAALAPAVGAGCGGAPAGAAELQAAISDAIATPPLPTAITPRKRRRLKTGGAPLDCSRSSNADIGPTSHAADQSHAMPAHERGQVPASGLAAATGGWPAR